MATDIAKIGFGVETSQLEKGVATLNSFSASAKSANNSAKSVGTAMNGAAKVFAAAVAGMSKSIASLVSVTQGATAEQIKAANEAAEFADRVYRAAQAQDKLAASTQKVTAAIKGQYNAFLKAASNESVLNRINRITGVTGLTGMSAKLSAMNIRQGKTAKEWAEAIGETPRDMMPNRFNTANIAAQFQDIGVTAAMGMNPLLIALQQGTQLSAVLNSMEKPLQNLKEGFLQIINPTSLWTIALTALAVVGLQMVDWIGVAQSSLNGLASAMDFVADNSGGFVSSLMGLTAVIAVIKFESIKTGLMSVYSVSAKVFTTFSSWSKLVEVFTKVKKSIIELTIVQWALENPVKAVTAAVLAGVTAWAAFSETARNAINKTIGYAIAGAYSIGGGMEALFKSIYKGFDQAFKELSDKNKKFIEFDYIGTAGETVESVLKKASDTVKEWSNKLNETDEKTKKLKEDWEKLVQAVNEKKLNYQTQQQTLGANIFDTNRLEITQDLLSQLNLTNISQLPVDKQGELQGYINDLTEMATQTEIVANQFNFAKETSKSFLSDLKQGLYEGQSAWKSFGDAVINVLDKMIDKLLDVGVDFMFSGLKNMGLFSATGEGGGLGSMIGDLFSFNAKGNAFDRSGIVTSPTLFKFAKGGKFGVMGEAGPEAIMPLKRGPDGSLGVRADAGVASNDVTVNVYNNANAQATVNQRQTSQGIEIDVMIDKIVSEKLAQPGTATNTSALAVNNRRLIAR